jgi:DNA-binding response OmpR family regulator
MAGHPQGAVGRILVVEDDSLTRMMVEDDLREAEFEVLGSFKSCAETLAWLDGHQPDAAIIDIQLADGPCIELGRVLREKQVPFVVLSGHPSNSLFAPAFAGAPWLEKPCSAEQIWEALRNLLGARYGRLPAPANG